MYDRCMTDEIDILGRPVTIWDATWEPRSSKDDQGSPAGNHSKIAKKHIVSTSYAKSEKKVTGV